MFLAIRMRCGYLTLLICLLVGLSACAPDLQPGQLDGMDGPVCDFDRLTVSMRVRNEGAAAGASVASVRFAHSGAEVRVETPSIGAKSTVAIGVPIPRPIPSPNELAFDIAVDVDNAVVENNESNNTASGGDCTPGLEP